MPYADAVFTGSGHEPHYLPELDRSSTSGGSARKRTVVIVAAMGSAVAAVLLVIGQLLVGLRLFGDQRAPTADEVLRKNQLTWSALAVFLLTIVVTFGIARRTTLSTSSQLGLVVAGVAVGPVLGLVVLLGLLG